MIPREKVEDLTLTLDKLDYVDYSSC